VRRGELYPPGASKSGQARLSGQLDANPGGIAADLQAPLRKQEVPREGKHNSPIRFVLQEEPAFQEKSMQRRILRKIALRSFALVVVLGAVWQAQAQDAKAPYPSMAPLDNT